MQSKPIKGEKKNLSQLKEKTITPTVDCDDIAQNQNKTNKIRKNMRKKEHACGIKTKYQPFI
jgi:hypothetical protein